MNRKFRKTLSFLLVTALCFSLSLNVFADSRSTTINSSTMHHTIATSTTTNTTRTDTTNFSSIWHQKGDPTSQTIDTTRTFYAASSLTTSVHPNVFASHVTSMGLSYSKTLSICADIDIGSGMATGQYYFYAKWTCVSLNQKVVTTYSGGSTTDYNRTISYVPYSSSYVYDVKVEM